MYLARPAYALAVILLTSAALALGLACPALASSPSKTCRTDMVTERGTCAKPVPKRPLTPAQKKQLAQAKADQERMFAVVKDARSALLPPVLPPPPLSYVLPEVEQMRLFKEGEGNHKKSYTCGPSATRNMIAALYKRKNGAIKDFGEAYFERIEGTTRAGTARKNIADALNSHFSDLGAWATTRPSSADAYLAHVMVSTTLKRRAVIANINTAPLSYFNGKNLAHFNVVYGYDGRGSKRLRIGEEWDPIYVYGHSNYGNPYGKHWERLRAAFRAIDNESIHGIVA